MNEDFFKSWKGSLAAAAVVVAAITGYKTVFGTDIRTQIEERRIAANFPANQPTSAILARQVAAATPYVGLDFTLGQFASYFRSHNFDVSWEPLDQNNFVMRATGVDALTNKPSEWAFQFELLDGPRRNGDLIGTFVGPAVGITGMAIDREYQTEMTIALTLEKIVYEVRSQPR